MSSEILAFQNTAMFCANRRAGLSQLSYSKSNTSFLICDVLLTFQLPMKFMKVNGLKTEGPHLYCRDVQMFYRIENDKFLLRTLAKPIS